MKSAITVLCSTGAFIGRVNGRDHTLLPRLAPQLHCSGFEWLMYESWYDTLDQITDDFRASGLSIPVFHCDKQIGELLSRDEAGDRDTAVRLYTQNCRAAARIGASLLVLHLWGGSPSDRNIQRNIDAYPTLAAIADDYKLVLTIENVVCNRQDPMTHLVSLHERFPEVKFTFDTKMAAFHSQLELIYEPQYQWLFDEGAVAHLHVNDYGGGHMDWANKRALQLGAGHIDFPRFFQYIKDKGFQGFLTIESTSMSADGIDLTALNNSLDLAAALSQP